ncbi:MAG: hypothetical protein H7246_17705 [Phycisphaerae bacterium]|nr:hypothetical protein [Saprospiraceae bacterium]
MEIAFGLLVLALIILGLRNRKKEKTAWVKEERYDESGQWIDKRSSGERGTYGSLDEEMEAKRRYIAKQSKISELAQIIQAFCFAQHPDFPSLSDEQIKRHLAFCKSEALGLFEQIEILTNGKEINIAETAFPADNLRTALKKQVLDFSFERFPKLLEAEIEQIKKFDLAAEYLASRILGEIERLGMGEQ